MQTTKQQLGKIARLTRLQQAKVQQQLTQLAQAQQQKEQAQQRLQKAMQQGNTQLEQFQGLLQGEHFSPEHLLNANVLLANNNAAVSAAKQDYASASEMTQLAMRSYLNDKNSLSWLETKQSDCAAQVKRAQQKHEDRQLTELYLQREELP